MQAKAFLNGRFAVALIMFVIFCTMVSLALTYPAQARFMPLVVGIPGILLTLIELIREIVRTVRSEPVMHEAVEKLPDQVARIVAESGQLVPGAVVQESDPAGAHRRELIFIAYFTALIAGVLLFGFWVAPPVFIVVFLKEREKTSWTTAVISAAAVIAVEYGAFERGLGISLFPGFITEWLLDLVGPGY